MDLSDGVRLILWFLIVIAGVAIASGFAWWLRGGE